MKTWRDAFEASCELGVWKLCYPRVDIREEPLFSTFDYRLSSITAMPVEYLEFSPDEWRAMVRSPIPEALLQFTTEGAWFAMQSKASGVNRRTVRFRFEYPGDLTMLRVLGITSGEIKQFIR